MYAVGYFLEVGIGTPPEMKEWVYALVLTGAIVTDFRVPPPTGHSLGSSALPRKAISARRSG